MLIPILSLTEILMILASNQENINCLEANFGTAGFIPENTMH